MTASADNGDSVQFKAHDVSQKRDRVRMAHEPLAETGLLGHGHGEIIKDIGPFSGDTAADKGIQNSSGHVKNPDEGPFQRSQ